MSSRTCDVALAAGLYAVVLIGQADGVDLCAQCGGPFELQEGDVVVEGAAAVLLVGEQFLEIESLLYIG